MRMIRQCAVAVAAASLACSAACSLDLQNPNSPTEEQVTTSVDGVIALATGLQGRFATSYGNFALHGRSRDRRVRVDERGADLDQRRRAGRGAVGHGDRRQRVQLGLSNGAHGGRPAHRARTRSPISSSRARAAAFARSRSRSRPRR